MTLLLENGTYIDWETLEFIRKDILVSDKSEKIRFVEKPGEAILPGDTITLDCRGKLVTKSFAVGHHHAYSALYRGIKPPSKIPETFQDTLKQIWWNLDKCLDAEMIESSALVTAIACAKAGSTFIMDHHSSPSAIKGSLQIIAGAFEAVGISHLLCYEVSDRNGPGAAREGLEETETYLRGRQGLVGLHASFTVGEDTMREAVDLMRRFNTGIHIHAAEAVYDQELCQSIYGKRVIERLHEAGVLNSSRTVLVHCIHTDENERDLIRNSPSWVVQNAESNMASNAGRFSSEYLGTRIMTGTDGLHSDALRSARACFFAGQGYDGLNSLSVYWRMRNVNRYIRQNMISGDGDNSLVVLDYDNATEINSENFCSHMIYGISSNHITDVISGGKIIVRNRKMVTVNEPEILEVARERSGRLWKRMYSLSGS